MLIEEYFEQIRAVIQCCIVVQSFNLLPEKRGDFDGFIRGQIRFKDGSILFLREFAEVETTLQRDMYSYQYMDSSNILIFRYDNTAHHKKLNLPTFPHHKHEGSEENIISSSAPFLVDVLREIEGLLG